MTTSLVGATTNLDGPRHTCATILFRRGWNAVQVQRWLGHHKPSFTLDTCVHLLDEDVPEPSFFDGLSPQICDTVCDTDQAKWAGWSPGRWRRNS
jgi:hypothetical protein